MKKDTAQFIRFCIVGGMNTAVDFASFFLFHLLSIPYGIAQALSYTCGTANSFFINRKWTFKRSSSIHMSEVIKFVAVNGVSFLCSFAVLYLLYDVGNWNLWMSKLLATGLGVVVNYIGSRLWVFSDKKKMRSEQI